MRVTAGAIGVVLAGIMTLAGLAHAQSPQLPGLRSSPSSTTTVQRMQPLSIVESTPGMDSGIEATPEQLDAIEDAKSKKRCIPADFIREAIVKDDKTIDLVLSGKKYYAIKLKDKCHGLGFDKTFYYYLTPARQLCARFDTIVTRSGSRCIIDKINKRDPPDPKKSKDDKKKKDD